MFLLTDRNYAQDREKQRLQAALVRVQDVERDLNRAIAVQKHYQQLYENLYGDYQTLLRGMMNSEGSTTSRASSINLGDWQSAEWLQNDLSITQSDGQLSPSPDTMSPLRRPYTDPT